MIARIVIPASLFTVTSVLSFSIWAWGGKYFPSEVLLYSACAVVFLLFGGISLLPGSGISSFRKQATFSLRFAIGFISFSVLWIVFWFAFRNTFGEVLGSWLGILAMLLIFKPTPRRALPLIISTSIVFSWYTVGYYLGEMLYYSLQGKGTTPVELALSNRSIVLVARLAWGVCFGLGMGTGLAHYTQISRQT
ncbi:MAG: hypothetical protein CMO55_25665 [Verrucomicrobiales bacterium]|nr:hypothetical protein [Verrucomicrobiales bacterium]